MTNDIKTETVNSVEKPPKARVDLDEMAAAQNGGGDVSETSSAKLERKKDYLEGFLSQKPAAPDLDGAGGDLQAAIIDALKEIYDPEIPVNIYDLGLIYNVEVNEGQAIITMTLTTPHCPVAESMPGEVELRAAAVPGVMDAEVNLVWDPPWSPANMTDEARLELGML
ncbi:SUF system Fe-S cluster assembly protein [Sphingorhabdus arenilitoris]|uniref:SUF system Fe-S cluster assembly protein n=1 Tax=Sphingorhabdus arenilitoris TaxID=1490041 RepID=A0ABV8RI50_9SPHN